MTATRMHFMAALTVVAALGQAACKQRNEEPAAASKAAERRIEADRGAATGEERERQESPDRITLSGEAYSELRLKLATAEERELAPALEVAAELVPDPDRRVDVGSRVPGRIVEFRAKIGDRVERGSPLVVIESPDVGRARADFIAASARAEVARQVHAREAGLFQAKATSQREVQEAAGNARVAEAELAAARARLASLGVPAGEERPAADPARVVLRSPIRGSVVARNAHPGQAVEPTTTLVQVIDLDQLWLEAQVYEREMRFVAPGQPVQLEARAFPGVVFKGKVDRIGETLDEKTRAVKVRVVLANPGHRLKPGMFATAHIIGTQAKEPRRMVAIPWAAIQEVDGHPSVFVRDGARTFELRRVHTGERAGDLVEVLNGVKQGDEVVAEGSFLLKGEVLKSTLGEEE